MDPFPFSTRIGVGNKSTVKERVQFAVERMMHEPVAYARLVDIAGLGVIYFEMVVPAVPIGVLHKFLVQLQNVLHQMSSELLHIFSFSLSFYELPPRVKQVFYRDDTLVYKTP